MKLKDWLKIGRYRDLIRVRTVESGEEMVNISKTLKNCICVYQNEDMLPYLGEDLWVRKTVAEKLQLIANNIQHVHPTHILKITYGYRHPEIQKFSFEKRKEELRLGKKKMSDKSLVELANTIIASPDTAGHPTGGAVDVTITTTDGTDLDMGTAVSDCRHTRKIKTYCESLTIEQKQNRQLLHFFMVMENFAPYYGEWWHYSYGDKEWSYFWDHENAIYDTIDFRTT